MQRWNMQRKMRNVLSTYLIKNVKKAIGVLTITIPKEI